MRRNGVLLMDPKEWRRMQKTVPPVIPAWMETISLADVLRAPPGRYRYFLSQLRRGHRGDLTAKIPSRRIRRDSRDVQWSDAVRSRDHWSCRRCHGFFGERNRDALDAAHVLSRRYKATRHLLEAGVALCRDCHLWAHRNPAAAKEFFIETIGHDAYDRLWMLARA